MAENLIAKQRPQLRLVASGKSGDDHFEGGAGTLYEMLGIEARVCTADLRNTRRDWIARACAWCRPRAVGARRQGDDLVAGRFGSRREQIATPFTAGPAPEHAAQSQD